MNHKIFCDNDEQNLEISDKDYQKIQIAVEKDNEISDKNVLSVDPDLSFSLSHNDLVNLVKSYRDKPINQYKLEDNI